MGYRGRLIRPMVLSLEQIDMDATRTADGYDDIFDEPKIDPPPWPGGVPPEGSSRGTVATQYSTAIEIEAQVNPLSYAQMRMTGSGNDPVRELECTFHFRDLEQKDLIDSSGAAKIRMNDRLVGLRSKDGTMVENWREDQYLYAIFVPPTSYGLPGATRNLLVVTFQERRKGVDIGV